MAYNLRGRRVAFDNILYATAASKEITAAGTSGAVSGPSETYFGGSNPGLSTTPQTGTKAANNMITVSGGQTSEYINETIINTNV